jgi:hypothetical protein
MWHKYRFIASLLGLLVIASCARTKTITDDELRSHVLSAISLASETELLIGQIENGRITQQFQAGHASYLRREAERIAQELTQSQIDSAHAQILRICSRQLDLLVRELTALQLPSDDKPALAPTSERVETIRKSLETAKAGL